MIISSIDIMDGKAVQLERGNKKILERDNIFELAEEFSVYGDIAVIDLDAALGTGDNKKIIKEMCRKYPCRVGGGIRTKKVALEYISAGAKKVIIGTKAEINFLKEIKKEFLIAAIDVKGQEVVSEGWKKRTGLSAEEQIKSLEPYVSGFLFTDIEKEGMLSGINLEKIKKIRKLTKKEITIAGGITTSKDILKIENLDCNSQIGMAIYQNKLSLIESFISVLNFNKENMVPTIVQDSSKNILMLAYSTKESLKESFSSRKATYFSRSRQKLWKKGETSGNYQDLISARYDCDRDTILFVVDQKGVACHRGSYSCFGDKDFSLDSLYKIIYNRLDGNKSLKNESKNSYTSKLLEDEGLIKSKIKEEALEVINYSSRENLVWELADLSFFMNALMVKKGISQNEILSELNKRRK